MSVSILLGVVAVASCVPCMLGRSQRTRLVSFVVLALSLVALVVLSAFAK